MNSVAATGFGHPSKLSVLLVEDDELDVLATRRALRPLSDRIELHSVWNGREALETLNGDANALHWPLVIVLDLNMPEMSGFEFLEKIRRDDKLASLPVIVFTTSDRESDVVKAYDFNVVAYVLKPMDPARSVGIVELLSAMLDSVVFPKQDPRSLN